MFPQSGFFVILCTFCMVPANAYRNVSSILCHFLASPKHESGFYSSCYCHYTEHHDGPTHLQSQCDYKQQSYGFIHMPKNQITSSKTECYHHVGSVPASFSKDARYKSQPAVQQVLNSFTQSLHANSRILLHPFPLTVH